jgi:hypothetical protein
MGSLSKVLPDQVSNMENGTVLGGRRLKDSEYLILVSPEFAKNRTRNA